MRTVSVSLLLLVVCVDGARLRQSNELEKFRAQLSSILNNGDGGKPDTALFSLAVSEMMMVAGVDFREPCGLGLRTI